MTNYPDHIKAGLDLESRVSAMAPEVPDIARLLEALRFMEATWGEDLAIVVDLRNGHGYIRRTFKSGKMRTSSNIGVKDGWYIVYYMTGADQFEVVCRNFAAAAFRFAEKPLPSDQAANFTSLTVARMAPREPDVLRILDALRLLEVEWGQDLRIVPDVQNGLGFLRRTAMDGEHPVRWSVGIRDGKYVGNHDRAGDQREEAYPNFVAAVYSFAGRPLMPGHAAALTKAADNKAALRS